MVQNSFKHLRNWWLPVGLYLLLSFLYLFAIPVGESPDEPGHMQCINQVTIHNRLPVIEPVPQGSPWWSRGKIVSGYMCYHMPLYYLIAGHAQRIIAGLSQTAVPYTLPPTNMDFGSEAALFVHEKVSFWHIEEALPVFGLRFLSIGLGLVMVWACMQVSHSLLPEQPLAATVAGVLAAGWPQFVYLSRALSNDTLANALAVTVLVVLLRTGRPYRLLAATMLSALAILTKLSVLFVVGVILAVWALEWVLYSEKRRDYWIVLAGSSLTWAATALLIYLHPVLREHFLTGTVYFSGISAAAKTAVYWWEVFLLTLSSGWARLGWMNLPAPVWHAYVWWTTVALTGLVGLYSLWHRSKGERQWRLQLAIIALWCAGIFVSYIRINSNRLQPQFRFALSVLPVVTMLMTGGITTVASTTQKSKRALVFLIIIGLLSYNLWFVFKIVGPSYGWQL